MNCFIWLDPLCMLQSPNKPCFYCWWSPHSVQKNALQWTKSPTATEGTDAAAAASTPATASTATVGTAEGAEQESCDSTETAAASGENDGRHNVYDWLVFGYISNAFEMKPPCSVQMCFKALVQKYLKLSLMNTTQSELSKCPPSKKEHGKLKRHWYFFPFFSLFLFSLFFPSLLLLLKMCVAIVTAAHATASSDLDESGWKHVFLYLKASHQVPLSLKLMVIILYQNLFWLVF